MLNNSVIQGGERLVFRLWLNCHLYYLENFFYGPCIFLECPLSYKGIKTRNEHRKSIFCNKGGVFSECSWVNDRKKSDRKAELGDCFCRCFIIWLELSRILHLKDTQLYLSITRNSTVNIKLSSRGLI